MTKVLRAALRFCVSSSVSMFGFLCAGLNRRGVVNERVTR
jgi:hypothetical protein